VARGVNSQDRRHARVPPDRTPWKPVALLRPGLEVLLINVSCGGALIESGHRMNPGTRTEPQLSGLSRRTVRGRIDRCQVTQLDPVRYQGAMVFEQPLEWHPGTLAPSHASTCDG
jgi:hypothetical protein